MTDALGSVMALVDSSGSVLNTYEYDVFGAVRSSSDSTANAFTFTGEQTDTSTGLEYLRARYGACPERSRRDPATGRFLSLDPMGDGYDYAYDNPVMNTDPSGLKANSACDDIQRRISGLGSSNIEDYWRRAWERAYDRFCGGGDGLSCGWTTDCSNGRGCDSTVVSKASNPIEGACWYDDEQPHRTRASGQDCGGGALKDIGCALTSPCGSFGVGVLETVFSFKGWKGQLAALGITMAYEGYDLATGNDLNAAVDAQAAGGNVLGAIGGAIKGGIKKVPVLGKLPGLKGYGTTLQGASIGTSLVSLLHYGTQCRRSL